MTVQQKRKRYISSCPDLNNHSTNKKKDSGEKNRKGKKTIQNTTLRDDTHTSTTLPDPRSSCRSQTISFHPSLFLASGLLGSLGDLSGTLVGLLNGLDDTYGDGLTHVTDGETTEGRVISEGLDAHWLGGDHLDDSGITRLDEFGGIFDPGNPLVSKST
jgi:hypothetical protein